MANRSQINYASHSYSLHVHSLITERLKVKAADIALYGKPISKATEHHLPYGITQCYLPLDTGE